MEEIKKPKEENATVEVVDVQFRTGQKVYYFDPAGKTYKAGQHLIIDTARGMEYGICARENHRIHQMEVVTPLRPVIRVANEQDEKIVKENMEKEDRAFKACLKKIEEMHLDMQLVSAECAFDGSKILFFFTADERVDFRELVKSLASMFHTRIELRQIGVRDKARMVGGLGICGRPFCCGSFLDDFQPVSIKMAKTQNLSLNPTKISGTCGRLMCCLKYEQDAYEDLLRHAPKNESFVDTPDGRGTVIEVDLMRQRVKVRLEEQTDTAVWHKNADIAILRSGKAKKNDPPIPADLAPISGSGKRKKEVREEENTRYLDSIRLRYSEETIAEETTAQEEPPVQEEKPEKKEKRKHRRNRRQKASRETAPEQVQEEKPEAPEKPENGEGQEKKKRNFHRRRHFHHKKPKSGDGNS
ncbi:MAG: stage 0 sporulation family protein [Oscillospiraceae bacterium]|nr:stage 0 sporulation family protein [Oscillospiraceae bacterium]